MNSFGTCHGYVNFVREHYQVAFMSIIRHTCSKWVVQIKCGDRYSKSARKKSLSGTLGCFQPGPRGRAYDVLYHMDKMSQKEQISGTGMIEST